MRTMQLIAVFIAGWCLGAVTILVGIMLLGVFQDRDAPAPLAIAKPTNTPLTIFTDTLDQLQPSNISLSTQAPLPSFSAGEIINTFQSAGLPISDIVAFTVETDPNSLLGRPSQYTEKISWKDNRIAADGESGTGTGGTLEIFLTAEDLQARKAYLDSVTKSASILVEYSYDFGVILLRLSHKLTPDQAQGYVSVLKALTSGDTLPIVVTSTPLSPQEAIAVTPKDPRDSPFIHGNNSPQLPPGEPGKVSVISFGKPQGGVLTSLPIVLRNNTSTNVSWIHVSAAARSGDGGLLAAGGDQGITPHLVQPGEIAFPMCHNG